jgi:archaellum biogenesis protein FlaJ (TadC family)
MDNYLLYLFVWLGLLLILLLLFKILPAKMRNTEDRQTKNSLFALFMMLSIPLILICIIGPVVLIAGDENMPEKYKFAFGIITIIAVGYIVYLQTTRKKES